MKKNGLVSIASFCLVIFMIVLSGCGIRRQMAEDDLYSLPKQLNFQAKQAPEIDYNISEEQQKEIETLQLAERANEPKITASFINELLTNAFAAIQMDTGINIMLADNVQGIVTCELENEPLSKVLDMLCFAGGFTWKKIETSDNRPYYIVGSVTPGDPSSSQLLVVEKIKTNRPALKVYDLLGPTFQPYASVVGNTATNTKKLFRSDTSQNYYNNYNYSSRQQSEDNDPIVVESYELTIIGPRAIVERMKREIKTRIDPPLKQIAVQVVFAEDRGNNEKKSGVDWSGGIDFNATSTLNINKVDIGSGVVLGWQNPIMGQLLTNIQLMAKNGKVRIKDAPQIMTREGYPATLKFEGQRWFKVNEPRLIGQEAYYTQRTTEPYRYGTILQIIPSIADNGDVVLRLAVKMDKVLSINNNGFPVIDQRSVESETQMASGATIILGGQENSLLAFEDAGIPGLSRIPIVKVPFSMQESKDDKVKLIVFVTAWVLEPETKPEEMVKEKTVTETVTVEVEKRVEVEKQVAVPFVDLDDWQKAVERGQEQNGNGK